MKKNHIVLIILTILVVISGVLAYYSNTYDGTITTRSKLFSFNVYKIINSEENTFNDIDLYDTAKVHNGVGNVIIPGDYGDFTIKVSSSGSEVKLKYNITLNSVELPSNMKFYLDTDKTDKVEINPLSINGILNVDEDKEYTIYWEWPYDSGENNINDIEYQGKTFTIDISITGMQAKETEFAINYIGFDNSVKYPSVIDNNEELTIDLSDYNYTSLKLKQGNNDLSLNTHYTYNNGILKLFNIIDDITITNLTSFCNMYNIDNLKDCLIATDYPNFRKEKSLENAKQNIENKVADFTKIEPYLSYTENNQLHITNNNYTINSNALNQYYYGTSTSFNVSTGNHNLNGGGTEPFATIDELINLGAYTCFNTYNATECPIVYKVYAYEIIDNKIVLTDYDKYSYKLNEDYSSKAGLYSIEDENNTKSYYFRGEVNNNWVSFGGYYYRILRINGDGSIRLIYSGTKENHTGSNTYIKTSSINNKFLGSTYIGYMYNENELEYASYPNTNPTKLNGYNTFTNINAGTSYYFSKNVPTCDNTTKTCTITCNVGTDCVYTTWPKLYDNYDKNDSSSTTNIWKYTSDYKYTCFGYADFSNNQIKCQITSEIKGVQAYTKTTDGVTSYIPYTNRAIVQYHGLFSPSYESSTTNITDSTMKITLDNWYKTNIYDKNLESYLVNQTFCNDRSISQKSWSIGDGYTLNKTTLYSPYYRITTSREITLICQNSSDKFTLKTTSLSSIKGTSGYGNNALDYPVGLMTADEIVLAGGKYNVMNTKYYLYNGYYNWTLSASYFNTNDAYSFMWLMTPSGSIDHNSPTSVLGVRPVINLSSETLLTGGSGTENDPYIVG